MSKIEKLKQELKKRPKTFEYRDAKRILEHDGFFEDVGTSGSQVRFVNATGTTHSLHKLHPRTYLLEYAVNALVDFLENEDLL